jgi:hydrogenase maturation factor
VTVGRETCSTCGDVAEAVVEVEGQSERVGIDLVPDARPGDLLLCHAGIALERLEGDRG